MNWDEYFINIAMTVKEKSKDPSSKIGAVIVGPDKQILSTGFNGFPRGIDETDPARWERPIKYDYVSHAERNAVDNAARHGVAVRGCKLYIVGMGNLGDMCVPCIECTKTLIQAGIKEIIGYAYKLLSLGSKYDPKNGQFALNLIREAGVNFRTYKRP